MPYKKLDIIIRPGKMDAVKKAMAAAGYSGVTVTRADGFGTQKGMTQTLRSGEVKMDLVPVDGKIFISDIAEIVRIRTGERGAKAL
jgi:nitrogen regulatory protein P-II 1